MTLPTTQTTTTNPQPPPQPNTNNTSSTTQDPTPAIPSSAPQTSDPKQTAEAKSAFTASLHSLGANYTTELVERAKVLHSNQGALSAQEENLAKTTEALRKQNDSWEGMAEEARKGLKEIGDVQNWAEVIERELLVLEETLRIAEEEEEREEERVRAEERGRERGRYESLSEDEEGRGVNGHGLRNGKVDEEGQKGNKGKGKEPATETKKGWFNWW
jgi:DNA mismatch repair protein PMS2